MSSNSHMKNNNFTLLHYLCAILVIFGHEFAIVGQTGRNPLMFGKISANSFGVCALFAISGYLVVGSFFRSKSIFEYFLKRIKRLFPPLLLTLFITTTVILLYYQRFSHSDIVSARYYIVHNFFLHCINNFADVFYDNYFQYSVNASLWSLLSEFVCYILLIPLCLIHKLTKRVTNLRWIHVAVWLLEIVVVLLVFKKVQVLGLDNKLYFLHADLEVMICFFVGCTINILKLEKYLTIQFVGFICLLAYCLGGIIPYIIFYDVVICIAIIALGNAASICKMPENNIYYEMYLYAWPIQQLIYNIICVKFGLNLHVVFMFILSLVVIILMAKTSNILLNFLSKRFDIIIKRTKKQ